MAFSAGSLVKIGGPAGSALYIYETTDAASVVKTAEYFKSASTTLLQDLTTGDLILLVSASAASFDVLYVTAATTGVTVTTAAGVSGVIS